MNIQIQHFSSTIFLFICLLSASCSTQLYEGEKRDPSQVAIIDFGDFRSHTVDGQSLGFKTKAEVLPGKKTIGYKSYRDYGMWVVEYPIAHMTFIARAGHTYVPRLIIGEDNPPKTKVVDVTSGKIVAQGVVGR